MKRKTERSLLVPCLALLAAVSVTVSILAVGDAASDPQLVNVEHDSNQYIEVQSYTEVASYTDVASTATDRCEWGLARSDTHDLPQADPNGVALLDQFSGRFIGDTDLQTVYFTFDLGYEAGQTEKILDILKEKNVHGIFFICGHYLESQPGLVERMISEGHEVGNHTDKHKDPFVLSEGDEYKDMNTLQVAFKEATGKTMKFYRPPQGRFTRQSVMLAQGMDLTTIMWSVAFADWDKSYSKGADYVKQLALNNSHNGAIYLFHLVLDDTTQAMPDIIDGLRADGYTIGEPGELVASSLTNSCQCTEQQSCGCLVNEALCTCGA